MNKAITSIYELVTQAHAKVQQDFSDIDPVVSYQFCLKDKDPYDEFVSIALKQVSAQQLYDWMVLNFSKQH